VLAAVGELQFDVVIARLQAEYGVETSLDRLPYTEARWIEGKADAVNAIKWPSRGILPLEDREGNQVVLFASRFDLEYCERQNPKVRFATLR
jgi:peptide chain release factor 3